MKNNLFFTLFTFLTCFTSGAVQAASLIQVKEALEARGAWTHLAAGDLDGDGRPELVWVHGRRYAIGFWDGPTLTWRHEEQLPHPVQHAVLADLQPGKGAELYLAWGALWPPSRDLRERGIRVVTFPQGLVPVSLMGPSEGGFHNGQATLTSLLEAREAYNIEPWSQLSSLRSDSGGVGSSVEPAERGGPRRLLVVSSRGIPPAQILGWTSEGSLQATTLEGPEIGKGAKVYGFADVRGHGRPEVLAAHYYPPWMNGKTWMDPNTVEPDPPMWEGIHLLGDPPEHAPAYRGVAALAAGDVDGDGRPDLLVGDGGHRDYGRLARGRLSWLTRDEKKGWTYQGVIEDLIDCPWVGRIQPVDLDGDYRAELLVTGERLAPRPQGWRDLFKLYRLKNGRWEGHAFPKSVKAAGLIRWDSDRLSPSLLVCNDQGKTEVVNPDTLPWTTKLSPAIRTPLRKPEPQSLVGAPAPKLDLSAWLTGEGPQTLADLKGKVVLLDFWSIDNLPLPAERFRPSYEEWVAPRLKQGLVVLGVTTRLERQDLEDIQAFLKLKSFRLPYPTAMDRERFTWLAYGIGAPPHRFLIDREGIVRWQDRKFDQKVLEQQLEILLK